MPIYCPRCGQQHLAPAVRFCSRCGFQLEGVDHLIAAGGLALLIGDAPEALSPRRRGTRFGAKVLFLGAVLIPVLLSISIMVHSPFPFFLGVSILFLGAARSAYARLFEPDTPRLGARPDALAVPKAGLLPPRPRMTTESAQRHTTGELEPPSITEHTTTLLDNKR